MSKKTTTFLIAIFMLFSVLLLTGCIVAFVNVNSSKEQESCNHVYDEVTIVTEPTCKDVGMSEAVCTLCGYKLQEEIPVIEHKLNVLNAVPATCLNTGITEGVVCEYCNEVLVAQIVIPALGHLVEIDEAVPATCVSTGLTEGSHCCRCEHIITAQEILPAQGHTPFIVEEVLPTCTESGLTAHTKCSVCEIYIDYPTEIAPLGHNFVEDTCTNCGIEAQAFLDLFTVDGNYTAKDAQVGDAIGGKVIRFYRPETGTATNYIIFDNLNFTVGAGSKMYIGSSSDLPIHANSTKVSHEQFVFALYEEYIDVYIPFGEYTIITYPDSTMEQVITFTITESSVITVIANLGYDIKLLTLNNN